MTLIDLAKTNPEALSAYTISEIVSICGDGKLLYKSPCSEQLRQCLSLQQPETIDAITMISGTNL
jgi:hypothetical protein